METAIGIANVVIAVLFGSSVAFAVAWTRARERAIRAELTRVSSPESDIRLERLQQSVEAIAVEVERISEAQRFAAKLQAEQRPAGAVAAPPASPLRVVTPH